MKRFAILLAMISVTLLSGLYFAPKFIDASDYQVYVQKKISQDYGLDLSVDGPVQFTILPYPSISASNIRVVEPKADLKLLEIEYASLALDLLAVLEGRFEVSALSMQNAQMRLYKDDDGDFIGIPKSTAEGKPANDTQSSDEIVNENSKFFIKNISVSDVSFEIYDNKSQSPVLVQLPKFNVVNDISKSIYALTGRVLYLGHEASFETELTKKEGSDYSAKVNIDAKNAHVTYNGALQLAPQVQAQGRLEAYTDDLLIFVQQFSNSKLLKNGKEGRIQGLLSYDQDQVSCSDCVLNISGAKINVPFKHDMSEGDSELVIKSDAPVNLSSILNAPEPLESVKMDMAVLAKEFKTIKLKDGAVIYIGNQKLEPSGSLNMNAEPFTFNSKVRIADIKSDFVFRLMGESAGGFFSKSSKNTLVLDVSGSLEKAALNANLEIDAMKIDVNHPDVINMSVLPAQIKMTHPNASEMLRVFFDYSINDAQYKKPFFAKFSYLNDNNLHKINDLNAQIAGGELSGSAEVKSEKNINIIGDFVFDKVFIPDGKSNPMRNKAQHVASKDAKSDGKKPSPLAGLENLDAKINLSGEVLAYKNIRATKPRMSIIVNDGNLIIPEIYMNIFGGSLKADASLSSQSKNAEMKLASKVNLSGVALDQLSSFMLANNFLKLTGKGNAQISVDSTMQNFDQALEKMNGYGLIAGENLVLAGVDLVRFAKALSSDIKFKDSITNVWKGTTKGGSTSFDALDADFKMQNGAIQFSDAKLNGPALNVMSSGSVNLVSRNLNTKHTIALQGEDALDPFEIQFNGSLDNPQQAFGEGLIKDYLNRKVQRKFDKLLSDKLGVEKSDADKKEGANDYKNEAPTLEDAAKDALKDALGNLFQ